MKARILLTLAFVLAVLALTHLAWAWSSGAYSAGPNSQPMASVISSNVVINEFESNPPTGGSQYVELYNPTSSTVDISGWTIRTVRAGNTHAVPAGTSLAPSGFWVATLPGQFIDNAGDVLMVLSTQSIVVDQTPMLSDTPSPGDTRTWQRIPDAGTDWQFLTGTERQSNAQTTTEQQTTTTQQQSTTTTTSEQQTSTTTEQATASTTYEQTTTTTSSSEQQTTTTTTQTGPVQASGIGFGFAVIGIGAGMAAAAGGLAVAASGSGRSEVFGYGGYYYCRRHRVPVWRVPGGLWCPAERRYLRA